MKSLIKLAAAATAFCMMTGPMASAESTQRAAAVVSGTIISTYDVDQRVRLVLSSGGAAGAEAQQRLREQVLRTLIDEILQMKEAEKSELTISEADINEALDRLAQQNNTTKEAILKSLAAKGIDPETLRVQAKAEIAWSRLVEERLAPRVRVSDAAIDQEMKRIEDGATKPQYLISEIFIAIDTDTDAERASRAINQLYAQINSGTPFPKLAQEFSESASAARGGDAGWVQDGDVEPEVWASLRSMRPMTISKPIRTRSGYYIVALRDKMRPAGSAVDAPPPPPGRPAGVPAGSVKLKRIILGVPPNMSKAQQQQMMQAAMGLREQIKGCQGLEGFIKQLRGVAVIDLPILPTRDLAPEIQRMIAGLGFSEVSAPYFTTEGQQQLMNMLVVCGDRPREDYVPSRVFEMPTREQVANRMFNEQLSILARRYMRDLRRDAAIEIRDRSVIGNAN
jgi:peptidyl-prolyl cis-trans isomerase SurA